MSALRSPLRWSFAFTAMFLFPAAIVFIFCSPHGASVFRSIGLPVALFAAGMVFAMACWTTRTPGTRSPWAIVASLADIATGMFIFRFAHYITLASPEPLLIASGIAGLLVFSRNEQAAPAPVTTATKLERVAGDCTSPWFDRAATVLFMLATWKVVSIWGPWAHAHHLPIVSGLLWVGILGAVALLTALIHEGGHALAAAAFGMRLMGFNAGPFQWRKVEGKWSLRFRASGVLGGRVHVRPTHPDEPAWHDICMVAAGPLINICTGPIFLWAAFHVEGTPWQPAWFFLALMASFSFLAAAFNLLPFRSGTGSYSDGARILQLLTNSPAVALHRAARLQPIEG